MPTIQVKAQTIYYDSLGAGSPLLLMHGWMDIGNDLRTVAERIAAAGYRVILPDLPGYGRSVPPFRSYPIDFYRRDALVMLNFLETLGLSDVHIMGFSDGGEVALLMPILRPALCRSVIAWGAVGAFDPALCDLVRRGVSPAWVTPEIRAKHPGQDVDLWPYLWVDAFCAIIAEGGDVSLSQAADIRCPLLLILGDQDALNPVKDGQRFIKAASKRRRVARQLEVFPGATHYVHNDARERFMETVTDFLTATNARPSRL